MHKQHWLAVDKEQVKSITKGWKTKLLQFEPPKAPKGVSLIEGLVHTAAKARPGRPERGDHKRRHRRPGDGQGGSRREERDKREE